MELSWIQILLFGVLLLAVGLFLFATLRGGKMIGGFMDRRVAQERDPPAGDAR